MRVLAGPNALTAAPTGAEDVVGTLLGPLTPEEVPIIRCVGLNYMMHSKFDNTFPVLTWPRSTGADTMSCGGRIVRETGLNPPVNPTVFLISRRCVADTRVPVPIPPIGQAKCDYEGELTVVIGRDAKDVSEADALDYVAGYVSGNDVSCRDWQMEADKAGNPQQWCFSKSFDKYAPLGPAIVSTQLLGDAKGLKLTTTVNGEVRQDTTTSDLCFNVRKLVSFFSTGSTLEAGSLIMTGTPSGVGLGLKPPKYLKDGDEVVIEIERIGKVRNVMQFE